MITKKKLAAQKGSTSNGDTQCGSARQRARGRQAIPWSIGRGAKPMDEYGTNLLERCVGRRYSIIYADPPWAYAQQGGPNGKRGMANAHYETMTETQLIALPVRDICTDDAVLFLWATFPNIRLALDVMYAWDFTYKTAAFVWVKKNRSGIGNFWGMGSYTRANAEVCLLGVSKGTKAAQQVLSHGVHSIIEAPVLRHSQKPAEARARIEQLMGDVPRIELFARERASGWDAWGNEVADA